MKTTADIIRAASVRGAAAFHEGIQSASASDHKFQPILKAACAANCTLAALDAWNFAWHSANHAVPIPGWTAEDHAALAASRSA